MTATRRSPGQQRYRRLLTLLKRPRDWRRGLDKDLRLLLTIVLIGATVLAASFATIREVERNLLRTAATGAAVHWAEFLQSHLRGLEEILAAGLVSQEDQRILEFAGAAGGVRDYQVIRPDGLVALSNWSGDFRGATDPETLRAVLEDHRTVVKVIEEGIEGEEAVIGQAYVPLASGTGKAGALKVDVDVTSQAERYRRLGNSAFTALVALLLPPGGLAGWLVARSILDRRRSERLQRQRGMVLEALARGVGLERVLLRIARSVETHQPGALCSILILDPRGDKVAACVAPQDRRGSPCPVDCPVEALPQLFAKSLAAAGPSAISVDADGAVWSLPLRATSGRLLGCLVLQFLGTQQVRAPDSDGPELVLAQLAAFAVEARRAERELAEMRQRNELILGAAADGIFGVDAAGRVSFANPAAARILGRKPAEIIGAEADLILRGSDGDAPQARPVAAALSDGKARHVEKMKIRGAGGRLLSIELVVTPIAGPLSSLCVVVVFHDISAQIAAQQDLFRAKEEAEAASRSKSSFLAHMSHELRTPLNAIIGFSEVMVRETLGPLDNAQYRDYAQHIHSSGAHLLSLINDLLDLSKIEAGKLELWEEEVDLRSLFERCRVFVGEAAQHKGIALSVDLPTDLPPAVCDARKIKQVVVNLLSNAIKFTEAGGRVIMEAERDGDAGVVIRVSDDGIGIAAHELKNVMAPFGQAREALIRDNEGTGLGLPLAKALVELHGGSLALSSRVGQGTTATVRLPGRLRPAEGGQKRSADGMNG
ncbi:ATP-binding protein [Pelagibius sp. CAU 1746]|uniref:sensor histidine kinase n=1 Tax=Pelagibius sp. CAU 1746 TaxID=3140370 RepID=UPI00325AE04C